MNVSGGLGKRRGRRLRALRGTAMVVAVGVAMLGGIAITATSASAGDKVSSWVCKYRSSESGVEILKNGGDGLIRIDTDVPVGKWFVDNQQSSYVLALATDANTSSPGHTYTGSGTCPRAIVDVPTLTATPGTCDAIGSVDYTNTDYYTWAPSGTPNATYYTATPIGNVVLVGVLRQGPFDLRQLTGEQCTTPVTEVTVATLHATSGTCDEPGTVDAIDTADYTWAPSGDPGVTYYTATAIGDVVLVGDVEQGPFDLRQLTGEQCNFTPPPAAGPAISLVKLAALGDTDGNGVANAGESIRYSFAVTNTGNVTLSDVSVLDAMVGVGTVTCPATMLAAGATFTCAVAAFPVTDANATGSPIVNEATASGQPPTGSRVSASASVSTPTGVVAGEVVTVDGAMVVNGAVVSRAPVAAPTKVTQLAFTGAETFPLGLSGLLALLLGVGLILVSRRRATD